MLRKRLWFTNRVKPFTWRCVCLTHHGFQEAQQHPKQSWTTESLSHWATSCIWAIRTISESLLIEVLCLTFGSKSSKSTALYSHTCFFCPEKCCKHMTVDWAPQFDPPSKRSNCAWPQREASLAVLRFWRCFLAPNESFHLKKRHGSDGKMNQYMKWIEMACEDVNKMISTGASSTSACLQKKLFADFGQGDFGQHRMQ